RNAPAGTAGKEPFLRELRRIKAYLASSRPTAVNLFWALDRMEKRAETEEQVSGPAMSGVLLREADAIKRDEAAVSRQIGEQALTLLQDGWGILTHCNAGAAAMPPYGTALAPLHLGAARGMHFKVYAGETRPLLQGARLTAWELQHSGIDVTLICDSAASIVMKQGRIQAVLVGCDRVAANGDTANKIGTSGAAILAKHYGIPFYVCSPLSTLDLDCPDGSGIVIEERPAEEITERWYRKPMAPAGIKVYNPAFDVTGAELITAIITEKGIARPPFQWSLKALF
ncbi:MAG: S-methyl-5-thioribose-1-phosphate isomerase, partial [Spirochaetales bacterium]